MAIWLKRGAAAEAKAALLPADAWPGLFPSYLQAGKTADILFTFANAAGNLAAGTVVLFEAQGAGMIANPKAVTDASGIATAKVITRGQGPLIVKATAVTGKAQAQAQLTVGATQVAVSTSGKKALINYAFAAGKKITVSGLQTKPLSIYTDDDSPQTSSYLLKKGNYKVVIAVAGSTILKTTVVIK